MRGRNRADTGDFALAPGEAPPAVVPYSPADLTSLRVGVDGQYLYVQANYDFAGFFPRGASVMVGGWSEAESAQYHHFAFDPVPAAAWTISR